MSLLNAAMALGTLAFVVPLAIHLLFRSRFRSMDWGAMFLLRDVVEANRRRMQWHHWILLALRCAIPLLLALAMARPLISSMKAMPGSQPISLIMVLDDSRSMSGVQRTSDTLATVNALLDSLSRQDEVILIPSSQLDATVAKGSVQDARDQLREVRFDGVSASLDQMVAAARRACSDASHPFRRIVICSDFQENVLDGVSSERLESLADSVASMNPKPEIDFLNIAANEDPGLTGNVVVESIEVDNPAILVDRKVRLSATIRNDSDAAITGLRCIWAIDGKDAHTESISISPRSTTPVRWSHAFDVVGGASVTLSVQHDDALVADNRRRMAVDVMRQVRVWLVDGDPSTRPLESETDFLKVALSPFAFRASGSGKPVVRTRSKKNQRDQLPQDIVSTKAFSLSSFQRALKELSEKQDEDAPDLLVFANVKQVPDIDSYLASGGSVLVFDGDQIDSESWRDCVWLPGKPFETTDATDPIRIEPPGGRYAPWSLLGGAGESLFDAVEIQRLRTLEPRDQQTSTLLRTESGQPLVMQRAFIWGESGISGDSGIPGEAGGEKPTDDDSAKKSVGRVVQFALPCDTAWSNLPLRPVFLPLIQQLVLDLAGTPDQLDGPPGTVFNITDSGPSGESSQPTTWRVSLPNGETTTVSGSGSDGVRFSQTNRVGVYRFTSIDNDSTLDATSQTTGMGSVRVVEVPAAESVLRPIVPELLDRAIAKLGGQTFAGADQWIASARTDRFGMEIWRPLMMLLLAVMVMEILWQQRGGTKARVPGKTLGSRAVSPAGAAA